MGFVKDAAGAAARVGTFGLAGALLGNEKKKPTAPQPSMISSPTTVTPYSMIGGGR